MRTQTQRGEGRGGDRWRGGQRDGERRKKDKEGERDCEERGREEEERAFGMMKEQKDSEKGKQRLGGRVRPMNLFVDVCCHVMSQNHHPPPYDADCFYI